MNMVERKKSAWLCALALTFLYISPSFAQTSTFQWGFATTKATSLQACAPLPITILPVNGSSGTPPYYMQAFAISGTPISTLVSAGGNMHWAPTHPPGTNLLLSMVDSKGGAGGVDVTLYTVIAGSTSGCIVNDNTSDFTISANVTDQLNTCQPWGLNIKGGVSPYTLTLASLNSTIVNNFTLPQGDNLYTYIDRTAPNGQLSASVSDSTGRWARGTPLVRTQGSTDVSCPGLADSSSNSNSNNNSNSTTPSNPPPQNQNSSSKSTTIAIAVAVPVAILLLLAGAAFWWRRKRHQQRLRRQEFLLEPDVFPRQYGETNQSLLNPNPTQYSSDSSLSGAQTPGLSESSGRPMSSVTRVGRKGEVIMSTPAVDGDDEEIVIHHRDGGAVREFPPPYADHGREESVSGATSTTKG